MNLREQQIIEWQEETGIFPGDTSEEARVKFVQWREGKKTCERCMENNGRRYEQFCSMGKSCRQIQEEVIEDEERQRQIDQRSGSYEAIGFEEIGLG